MPIYYRLILYIIFGVLPSLVWLFYYLQKDMHPEPKRKILVVFFWGAISTIPVLFLQILFSEALVQAQHVTALYSPELSGWLATLAPVIKWFIIIAFVEELFKYFVVRLSVFNDGVLDEPLDIMLYMVVAALGFAAMENIMYLFSPIDNLPFSTVIATTTMVSFIRFIGATFLHTLCSALLGYFLALSYLRYKSHVKLFFAGLGLATLLHGLYDFSIIKLYSPVNITVSLLIVAGLALFMIYDFNEVKKIKSICKL